MIIANPLYDTVFKYLLEDQEIATEFLSNILDLQILELSVRSQETSSKRKRKQPLKKSDNNPIALYRLDFKAKVLLPNGSSKLILIELQKAKVSSMLQRFRIYLGNSYSNVQSESDRNLEIVSIYITGFPIDDQPLPPFFWSRRVFIDGLSGDLFIPEKEVNFVNQLTHESCFIHVNGFSIDDDRKIAKMMRLFDQKQKTDKQHFLQIENPKKGTIMSKIAKRLYSATLDDDLLRAMQFEEQYEADVKDFNRQIEEERRMKEEERKKKFDLMRRSIISLSKLGVSNQSIADMLGIDVSEVDIVLNEE